MLPRPLVVALAVMVSIAWAVNLIVGFLYPGRNDPALNMIFMIVVGAAFALERRNGSTARKARRKLAEVLDPKREPEQDDRGDES